ncbi:MULTISPECIES: TPM domain-containing protein [unclassified Minwuia]|jgi:uncharacterized protein|uniref:TPM domain-containing protein n=1 Tax=unclassified Minwuia TaxID=2618799 RepID=UPI00247A9F9D|nr:MULTISPECIES: TPM domain-containing protein [unclassified Minwuia]
MQSCLQRRATRTLPVLLALVLWAGMAAAQTFPPLTGRVLDQAGVLDAATKQQLTTALAAHEKATSNQVVVVTLQSLEGYEIADYGYRLGRAWGIGQEGRNNGALLIVAPTERKVRIEVGYGLEGSLTDATSRLIIENEILPAFRNGDLAGGIVRGTNAILQTIAGTYAPLPNEADDGNPERMVALFPILLFLVFFLMAVQGEGGGPRSGRRRGRRMLYGGGLAGGSGGFGGGSGGGFGGGGGGFGGGGSSGSW